MPPRYHPDLIALFERFVKCAESDEEKEVELPTRLARSILELAKTAKKPKGRTPLALRERRQEWIIINRARRRKADLVANGMSATNATELASKEAQHDFLPRALSVETVKRMLD
jgi:Holliday junction resolvase